MEATTPLLVSLPSVWPLQVKRSAAVVALSMHAAISCIACSFAPALIFSCKHTVQVFVVHHLSVQQSFIQIEIGMCCANHEALT